MITVAQQFENPSTWQEPHHLRKYTQQFENPSTWHQTEEPHHLRKYTCEQFVESRLTSHLYGICSLPG